MEAKATSSSNSSGCKSTPGHGLCACHAFIGPSILNSDLARLGSVCQSMLDAQASYLHLDVMDGHFVPNLTFGAPVIKSVSKVVPTAFLEAHMMVSEPLKWVQDMKDAGVHQYTFHVESTDASLTNNSSESKQAKTGAVIRAVRAAGMRVGLAVKPNTPVEDVLRFVPAVDMVLIMTVEPGFGGQSFMANMMSKVTLLRTRFPLLGIEVDGGISGKTIDTVAQAGANWIVSGSAIIKSDDPAAVIRTLKTTVKKALRPCADCASPCLQHVPTPTAAELAQLFSAL